MSNATPTALATASTATVYAVAAAVKADTTSTTLVQGRTTYTVTTTGTNVVEFDGGRARFQMTVKVTRTTSRSTKTFQAHLSVDNYTGYDGVVDSLRIAVLYNENGNAVYAAEFDGYRAAAMAHAVQVTTTALEAVEDQETAVETAAQDTAVETVEAAQETTQETPTAQETVQDQESAQETVQDQDTPTALEDTTVETVLDPETGGRTLDAAVREALRGGPDWSRDTIVETRQGTVPTDAEREAGDVTPFHRSPLRALALDQETRQGTVPTDAEREAAAAEFRQETAAMAERRREIAARAEATLARAEAGLKDTLAQSADHLQAAAQARHDHLAEWEAHLQAWGRGEAETAHAGAAQIAHTHYRRAMRAFWSGVAPTSHGDLHHLKQAAEAGDLVDVERHLGNLREAGLLG